MSAVDLALKLARHPQFIRTTSADGRKLAKRMDWVFIGEWWAPDLTDWATVGVLWGMLRACNLDAQLISNDLDSGSTACITFGDSVEKHTASCDGEAIARALLAVWGPA